jgi:hypothetical protein
MNLAFKVDRTIRAINVDGGKRPSGRAPSVSHVEVGFQRSELNDEPGCEKSVLREHFEGLYETREDDGKTECVSFEIR